MLPGHRTVDTCPGLWSLRLRIPWSFHHRCRWSKCHLWSPQHPTISVIPSCGGRIPSKGYFFGRGPGQKTWSGLTTTLVLKHFPDLDKTQKGHTKGQRKRVRLTKVTTPVTIKVELGTANPPLPTIKKHYDIFIMVYKLLDAIHTDQTGAFLITSQQGYQYIMVGIHLDANYIFCELMKNRKKARWSWPTKEWSTGWNSRHSG